MSPATAFILGIALGVIVPFTVLLWSGRKARVILVHYTRD